MPKAAPCPHTAQVADLVWQANTHSIAQPKTARRRSRYCGRRGAAVGGRAARRDGLLTRPGRRPACAPERRSREHTRFGRLGRGVRVRSAPSDVCEIKDVSVLKLDVADTIRTGAKD